MPVQVIETSKANFFQLVQGMIAPLLGPLGTAALVLLLVIFMLLKREDLRSRLIRLVGRGRITATTRAMDDAGARVARYLLMQFVVNVTLWPPRGDRSLFYRRAQCSFVRSDRNRAALHPVCRTLDWGGFSYRAVAGRLVGLVDAGAHALPFCRA